MYMYVLKCAYSDRHVSVLIHLHVHVLIHVHVHVHVCDANIIKLFKVYKSNNTVVTSTF